MRITSPNQAFAISRHVRTSPFKARQVTQGLRGMSVAAAVRQLQFTQKGAARPVLKTLNSAIANAEHNQDLDVDDLFVLEAKVDEGPTLKRFQPRAMGRAYQIRKRTCHISITVGLPPVAATASVKGTGKATAGKATAGKTTTRDDSTSEES